MEKYNDELIENTGFKDIPKWLNEQLFEEILMKDFPKYKRITKFIIRPAVKTGENFMTIMLRVTIELELYNNTKTTTTYMAKIKPSPERMQFMIKEWRIFFKEHNTYTKYIKAFEKYYREAGCNIKLAPNILDPCKTNINDDALILEDLRPKGFTNFNRHLGLDLEHTKAVLKKLAQFHAASVQHFQVAGPYLEIYDKCLSSDKDLYEDHRVKLQKIFRDNLQLYGNFQFLDEKLKILNATQTDPLQLKSDWKTNGFNVLNHGDCWTNNIMFQYDQQGRIRETLLIDFQMSRFGSPAQDLYYFLLSSTNFEVKLKCFDYFIYYYHRELTKHLKLLKFKGTMPQLREIHIELLKHDYWAYHTISSLMPIILFESRDDANVDNLIDENNDDLKISMYTNDLYVKAMNMLLPWLNQRGVFDV